MPRSWLGSCRMCVQLDAPIPFAQRAWLGCCACAWGRGSWGVRPNCRSVEAGPTARVSGIRQDSDLGLRLSAHRPGSTTRAGNTSLQDWRPAVPGWLLLCPFLGVGTIPATTLGEWTPASQSQQEEGPKDKLRGGLSWGHSGSSMAGGRADMGTPQKDVTIKSDAPDTLLLEKHADYIASYGSKKDDYEYCMSEYLRMSGIYWGLTVMDLMGQLHRMNKEEILAFIKSCQHECGGMSASIGHDPHLLYTLSAVQILTLYDSIDVIDVDKVVAYVQSLQKEDGSFAGDIWGEIDTRFSFCAVATLALLGKLDAINVEKAIEFVLSCMNFDGGFGCRPGSESHAGQIYCCTGFLAITSQLHQVNSDLLGWWLCERQLPSGGLNGRPEKLPDVCYSWWVLASLKIIGRLHWIDREKLRGFILACQDEETGGFADRPGDMVDPFHTLFGIAGLSLLGEEQIKPVSPVFCMPEEVLQRVNVQPELVS